MRDSTQIIDKVKYNTLMAKFDKLALSIAEYPPEDKDSPIYIEMASLANLIETYEDVHFPINTFK